MKRFFKSLRIQRILLSLAHGDLKFMFRKGISLFSRRGFPYRLKFPYMVALEVTTDCPLDCIMCPRSQLKEKRGYMSFDLFQRTIQECAQHYTMIELVFTGMGEPLMHPRILDMIRHAKRSGIPTVHLFTNALALTKEKSKEILENSGLDLINISLDALTRETYEKVKGSSQFDAVQNNIENFLKQRKDRGLRKPFVKIHILKMKETAAEIHGFIQKWRPRLGKGDDLLIKEFHTFAGLVDDRSTEERIDSSKRFPCRQLWELAYISWDGDVMPCCIDVMRKLKIGSLQESTLKDIWNSPAVQSIRNTHREGHYDQVPLCSKCEIWWYLTKKPV